MYCFWPGPLCFGHVRRLRTRALTPLAGSCLRSGVQVRGDDYPNISSANAGRLLARRKYLLSEDEASQLFDDLSVAVINERQLAEAAIAKFGCVWTRRDARG